MDNFISYPGRILILILGAGRYNPDNTDPKGKYNLTTYFFSGKPLQMRKTPFIGDAILALESPGYFSKVYILGTKDSLWQALNDHCGQNEAQENRDSFTAYLHGRIQKREIDQEDISAVASKFGAFTGVETEARFLELGKSDEEFWEIFEMISDIPQDGQEVCIDITHGLRYQPFFLLLALYYLQTIRLNINLGKVYYGAQELKGDFDGLAPIFNLQPMVSMLAWAQAAQGFNNYGDIRSLISHAQKAGAPDSFVKAAKKYAQEMSLGILYPNWLKTNSQNLLSELDLLEDKNSLAIKPLQLLAPTLRRIPEQLVEANQEWEILLRMAHQLKPIESQKGFAIMTLYEAIITKLALISGTNHLRRSKNIVDKALATEWVRDYPSLKDFPKHMRSLKNCRNATAHRRADGKAQIQKLEDQFDFFFEYFTNVLQTDELQRAFIHARLPKPKKKRNKQN